MKITHDIIKALKPCQDRFENFTGNYPNYSDSTANFLSLENITYEDKIWVMTRLMNKNENLSWAVSCAYSVLPIFEKEHPNDKRPRKLLEFMGSLKDCNNISNENLNILVDLRKSAVISTSRCQTIAAVSAACAIVIIADHVTAENQAAISTCSYYTSATAGYAAGYRRAFKVGKKVQQDLNLQLLLKVLSE